jgi:cyclopropane fatty-acyl-phospholipid synthase-like methyltransferase
MWFFRNGSSTWREHHPMTNEFVRDAYNRIAGDYANQRDQFHTLPYLERFAALVPTGKPVLDIGCGAGLPVDAFLTGRGHPVHGLDISASMIELAQTNVPQAIYAVRDMTGLNHREFNVSGIVSLYAIFHTPRETHGELLRKFASFMPNGGTLLITMGSNEWEGYEDDFHGSGMFWSHFGPDQNIRMLENAGFTVIVNDIDHAANEAHQFIIATMEP